MKIKLEHLSPYLPYGLKVKLPVVNKKTCREYVIGTVGAIYSDASICCHDTVNSSPDWFKPILRPMSQIQKQINHDGNCFIPSLTLKLSYPGEMIGLNPAAWSYRVIQKLFEWHFDIFGLIDKGLAVPYS